MVTIVNENVPAQNVPGTVRSTAEDGRQPIAAARLLSHSH
jgi:hypothetical protein